MQEKKYFCDCKDVIRITGVEKDKAWQIIRRLNKELAKMGYCTIRGKVPYKYLKSRMKKENKNV